ncbi:hypothetical protein KAR91_60560 [Candidatus Pacearchaeota archaeon]|nr:hypothetical protein [Candidatus Pacearchaeota archaeon]
MNIIDFFQFLRNLGALNKKQVEAHTCEHGFWERASTYNQTYKMEMQE